jgi:hypothetical protein
LEYILGATFNLGPQGELHEEPTENETDLERNTGDVPDVAPEPSVAPPEKKGGRRVVMHISAALVGIFAVWHIVATSLYATPATPLRELVPEAAFTAYNYPMFDQNWSVFAPEPISANYELSVRAAELVDGELVNTKWVNASKTEVKLLRHNPLSPRAGYAAYAQALGTNLAYNKLTDAEQAVVAESYYEGDMWGQEFEEAMRAQGGSDEATVNAYLKQEWVTVAYATQVAKAVWGDDVAYVQYSISIDNSVPFASRHDAGAQRSVVTVDSGWRGLVERPGQDDNHFADLFTSLDPVIIGEEDTK